MVAKHNNSPLSRCAIHSQRGVSAGLVLTVMAVLGGMLAYAVTSTSGMHNSVAQEIMQARAQQAANAGLQWARYKLRFNAATYCPSPSGTVTVVWLPLSGGAIALTMPVTVRCTPTGTHTEASTPVNTYQLSANACSPAGGGGTCPNLAGGTHYVEWQMNARAER